MKGLTDALQSVQTRDMDHGDVDQNWWAFMERFHDLIKAHYCLVS